MNLEPVRRISLNTLFSAAILLSAGPGLAQQQFVPNAAILEMEEPPIPEYAVEMIVFEYTGSAASTTEIFAPDVEVVDDQPPPGADFSADIPPELPVVEVPIDDELSLTMAIPDETGIEGEVLAEPVFVLLPGETLEEIPTYESRGIRLIPPEEYQLQSTWNRLKQLAAYRPLMHTAWIQPTVEQEATKAFPLRRIGDPPLRLEGAISLYLSRFLHMAVDLSLEQKAPQLMPATEERVRQDGDSGSRAALSFDPVFIAQSTFYRIEEDRIVRNNELRYFDHPKFGVIAKITRIEQEVPEDLDTTGDLLPGNTIQ
ncbi:MAG: CsiV family protein [Woeseiaceae bacterium]|nr:CsiV family protein [Woeseiaceae bacterium]